VEEKKKKAAWAVLNLEEKQNSPPYKKTRKNGGKCSQGSCSKKKVMVPYKAYG
jgi:hypothetical protein